MSSSSTAANFDSLWHQTFQQPLRSQNMLLRLITPPSSDRCDPVGDPETTLGIRGKAPWQGPPHRHARRAAHTSSGLEDQVRMELWFNLTNFIRLSEIHVGTRRCQKCFGLSDDQDSEDESDSSSVSSSSGSEDNDE